MSWKYKDESQEPEEDFAVESPKASKKRYVAVVDVSLDKYKKRFRPGDEIPLEYLEDSDVAFDWLLLRGAIKELGS